MKIKLLGETKMPQHSRPSDAGYDLFLNDEVIFKPHETTIINLGVCVQLPPDHAGLLAIRSSVSKTGLIIQQPLIDENYRGEIHAIVFNPTDKEITYLRNDRICSLYVFPIYHKELELVDELDENTERGTAWSGSSGR